MNRNSRSGPGQRMIKKTFGGRGLRPSKTAALGALLAVAVLAATAVGLIGGRSALADGENGESVLTTGPTTAVRAFAEPATNPVAVPQMPADAEYAQPIATF